MNRDAAKPSLRERKQSRARREIVDAAYELFGANGFGPVSVASIAEHAGVGRTTFFRYFGDKQEVLFADEADVKDLLVGSLGAREDVASPLEGSAFETALAAVRKACVELTSRPERFALRSRLVAENDSLSDREERKLQKLTAALVVALESRGFEAGDAVLASELAFAVLRAARRACAADPAQLVHELDALGAHAVGLFVRAGGGVPERSSGLA